VSARLEDYDDVMTIEDVAAVLKTSRTTIFRQRRAGVFPIPEIPGIDARVRYAKAAVSEFLNRSHATDSRRRGSLKQVMSHDREIA
jgi:predicted DNA-binding transcriptional regulator AlpA